jgi:hypothetical protein
MAVETIINGGFKVTITEAPIKPGSGEAIGTALLQAQAEAVGNNLVKVDLETTRGTCMDERPRVDGEPRPSVPAGPDVYALMIAELTGYFSADDDSDMNERLGEVKKEINREGILSGGHKKCAANASLPDLIRMLAENPEAFLPYAKDQLSDRYEDGLAQEVVGYARAVVASGRYATWTEAVLADVLGEEAEEAIEELDNVPHEGLTVVRVEEPETTIDQTKLYEESELGDGSFNVDD